MLDRVLRRTFRCYGTLFLFVLSVTLPLHLAYTYVFQDVFTVSELHTQISRIHGKRQVHGVDKGDIRAAQTGILVLAALEVALIPLLATGARRIVERDRAGQLPTVVDAFRHLRLPRRASPDRQAVGRSGVILLAAVIGALAGLLVERIGLIVIQPFNGESAFVAIGSVQAIARAAGAPFLLTALAVAGSKPVRPGTELTAEQRPA